MIDNTGNRMALLRPSQDEDNPGWVASTPECDASFLAETPEEAWAGLRLALGGVCPWDGYTKARLGDT